MIQLTETLVITSDGMQYILATPRRKAVENNKDIARLDTVGYYTSISAAIRGAVAYILRGKVADSNITTLRGYLNEEKRLHVEFAGLLEPLESEVNHEFA